MDISRALANETRALDSHKLALPSMLHIASALSGSASLAAEEWLCLSQPRRSSSIAAPDPSNSFARGRKSREEGDIAFHSCLLCSQEIGGGGSARNKTCRKS